VSPPVCDFCNSIKAAYALPCADLALQATGAHGTARTTLAGAWSACAECLTYVERGDSDGLADYVTEAAHGPPALLRMTTAEFRRDVFKQLYKRVLPQLGAPRPLAREAATVGAGGALRSVDGGNGG